MHQCYECSMYFCIYLGLYLCIWMSIIIIEIYLYVCIFFGLTVVQVFGLIVVQVAGILANALEQTILRSCIIRETTLQAINRHWALYPFGLVIAWQSVVGQVAVTVG